MGKMMSLFEVIRDLDSFDEGATIYAREPWTKDSRAIVVPEPDTGGVPVEAAEANLEYFLEVSIAREFFEGWTANSDSEPSPLQKCERLITYAMTDA